MTRAAEIQFPAWPALLTTEFACAYTSLSEVSFRLLARKMKIHPVECAGLAVVRWRRTDLDALIDRLPPRGAEMPAEGAVANTTDPAQDAAQAALQRAEKRARG